ncbi:MAG TPA: hypothetical protein VE596_08280 [Gaiellaceae bacterium]|nr:hypothetical protein [Gaiellaceae bacterium]
MEAEPVIYRLEVTAIVGAPSGRTKKKPSRKAERQKLDPNAR